MSRHPSPIERMQHLADDGMEPWQIAAALGVREQAVLVALGDQAAPGGAQRAVEAASSVAPAGMPYISSPSSPVEKPATPTYGTHDSAVAGGSAVQTLNGRIAALGATVSQIRDWARRTGRPVPDRGMIGAALVDEWAVAHSTPLADVDEAADRVALAAEIREHFDVVDSVVDAITPAEVDERLASLVGAGSDETPQETHEHADCWGCVAGATADYASAASDPLGDLTAAVLAVVDAPWPLALEAVASVALDRDPEYGAHQAVYRNCPVNRRVYDGRECDGPGTYYCDAELWGSACRRYFEEKQCADAAAASPTTAPTAGTPSASTAAAPAETTTATAPSPAAATADPSSATDGQPATTPPEHVHDPFVAFTEAGIPYATCECGTTWERQTCQVCPAIVAALHVATFGPVHKHCAAKKNTTERTNP